VRASRKPALAGPDPALAWRESRALVDAGRLVLPLLMPAGKAPATRPRDLILLPGFGAGDRASRRGGSAGAARARRRTCTWR